MAGVSLITVRRALEELERDGRVAGHQGVGTFVARPRIVTEPARRGGLLARSPAAPCPAAVATRSPRVRDARRHTRPSPERSGSATARACGSSRLRRIDGVPMVARAGARAAGAGAGPGRAGGTSSPARSTGCSAAGTGSSTTTRSSTSRSTTAGAARAAPARAARRAPRSCACGRQLRGRRHRLRLLRAGLPGRGVRLLHLRAHVPPPASGRRTLPDWRRHPGPEPRSG